MSDAVAPPIQEQIDEIMDNIDFAKIRRVMEFLGWTWGSDESAKVPDTFELRQEARRLLRLAAKDGDVHGCGGFQAENWNGYLSLSFQLAEWSAG